MRRQSIVLGAAPRRREYAYSSSMSAGETWEIVFLPSCGSMCRRMMRLYDSSVSAAMVFSPSQSAA